MTDTKELFRQAWDHHVVQRPQGCPRGGAGVTTYYKATRPDGTDFRTGTVLYEVGATLNHPDPHKRDASGYLSVATVPTDCTGMSWPCRLFEVEADDVWTDEGFPNKRCTHSLRVARELPAHVALGPQGEQVAALIERARALAAGESVLLHCARDAARYAAWGAAWYAARGAAWDAARDAAPGATRYAARYAARDAALGLTARDLITAEQYDTLTLPWRKTIGRIHPDDPEASA